MSSAEYMNRYVDTGAWVGSPDVYPDYWADKAKRDAERAKRVSPEELEAFKQSGGVAALAIRANTAVRSGEYYLPSVVHVHLD